MSLLASLAAGLQRNRQRQGAIRRAESWDSDAPLNLRAPSAATDASSASGPSSRHSGSGSGALVRASTQRSLSDGSRGCVAGDDVDDEFGSGRSRRRSMCGHSKSVQLGILNAQTLGKSYRS